MTYIFMTWNDAYIRWNPEDYGGRKSLWVPMPLFWYPVLPIAESTKTETIPQESALKMKLFHNGSVLAGVATMTKIGCNFEVKDFPFDVQTCTMTITTPDFTEEDLKLHILPKVDPFAFYSPNIEWDFLTWNVTTQETDYDGDIYSELKHTLVLKRYPGYYESNIMLPTYVITCLCIVGLFSPFNSKGERQEKVTMGLTSLLSMSVILLMTTGQIPKTSDWTVIGVYIMVEIFFAAGGVLLAVLIMFLQVHGHRLFPKRTTVFCDTKDSDANSKESSIISPLLLELRSIRYCLNALMLDEQGRDASSRLCAWLDLFFMISILLVNTVWTFWYISGR